MALLASIAAFTAILYLYNPRLTRLLSSTRINTITARNIFATITVIDETQPLLHVQIANVVFVLSVLFSFFKIFTAIYCMICYKNHKAYKKMEMRGRYTAEQLDKHITTELAQKLIYKSSKITITDTWLIATNRAFTFTVRLCGDFVWAYNTVIYPHLRKKHVVILRFRDKTRLIIQVGNAHTAIALLQTLKKACPSIITGHNQKIEEAFNDNSDEFLHIKKPAKIELPPPQTDNSGTSSRGKSTQRQRRKLSYYEKEQREYNAAKKRDLK